LSPDKRDVGYEILNLTGISTLELLTADELKKIMPTANEKNPRALMFSSLRDIETGKNTIVASLA
jgi:hypothetical protein